MATLLSSIYYQLNNPEMAQLKELLEKEELEYLKEVKEDLTEGFIIKERPKKKRNKTWIWIAAIIAAVVIFK